MTIKEGEQIHLAGDDWGYSKFISINCFAELKKSEKSVNSYLVNSAILNIRGYESNPKKIQIGLDAKDLLEFAFGCEEMIAISNSMVTKIHEQKKELYAKECETLKQTDMPDEQIDKKAKENVDKAFKPIYKKGYEKITRPGGTIKKLELNYKFDQNKHQLFLNVHENSADDKVLIGTQLNKYEIRALGEALRVLYGENKRLFYRIQREFLKGRNEPKAN